MKTKHVLASLFAAALLLVGSSAMAQEAHNALRAGQANLSFGVPSGGNPYFTSSATPTSSAGGLGGLFSGLLGANAPGGALGYHYMFTDKVRGGLNLAFDLQDTDAATVWNLGLAPQVNYYFGNTKGTVAPFAFGQINFGIHDDGNDQTDEDPTLGIEGGMGVEWFPVPRFSISGRIGLNLGLLGVSTTATDAQGNTVSVDQNFGINLFTSSLAANIYF